MAFGFLLVARAPSYLWVIIAGAPIGMGRSGFMLTDNALLMSNADRAFHGRVMSLAMMGFGTQALLAPVWGLLADAIGVRETFVVIGIVSAVVTTVVGLSWLRVRNLPPSSDEFDQGSTDPAEREPAEPAPAAPAPSVD